MKTTSVITLTFLMMNCAVSAHAQTLDWIRQLGSSGRDEARGVSADRHGNVFVTGWTDLEAFPGTNVGEGDAFVSKYNNSGTLQWTRILGTAESDWSFGASSDGLGGVFITGRTGGDLGGTNSGPWDAFVSRYDSNGDLDWTQQFGTSESDVGVGVSADGLGNVYVAGLTSGDLGGPHAGSGDVFISMFDTSGNLEWSRQLGTSSWEEGHGVSADGLGSVYVVGETDGSLGTTSAGERDAFISKFDENGSLEWTSQIGSSAYDTAYSVSTDGLDAVYIVGLTYGDIEGANAGNADAFLSKFDADGILEWTRQLGTSEFESFEAVSTDRMGGVYVTSQRGYVSKFDASGIPQWTRPTGGSGWAISADGMGAVYVAGNTIGSLGGPSAGSRDVFVAKYFTDMPLPPGDGNFDGIIDGLDFLIWAGHFGDDPAEYPPGSPANGDYNNDGVVDELDYLVWADNMSPQSASVAAVPETVPGMLALMTGVVLCANTRRRSVVL